MECSTEIPSCLFFLHAHPKKCWRYSIFLIVYFLLYFFYYHLSLLYPLAPLPTPLPPKTCWRYSNVSDKDPKGNKTDISLEERAKVFWLFCTSTLWAGSFIKLISLVITASQDRCYDLPCTNFKLEIMQDAHSYDSLCYNALASFNMCFCCWL